MDAEKAVRLRQIIERAKRDLIGRYDAIHAAMRGEFMSAVYSPAVPSSKAQSQLDRKLSTVGGEAARTERSIAKSITQEIKGVVGWIETPEMVANLYDFQIEIVRQISRDSQAVSSLFRQVQTVINTLPKDKHVSAKAQALRHITKPNTFTYKDKAGKIWYTKIYLKAHSSQYYYGLANDLAIGDISSENRKSVTLNRPDHLSDGIEFDLVDITPEMKSKYLHPGSQGILI